MFPATADQRILKGRAATLTVTLADSDGEPADAAGAVTVRVQRWDGTDLLAAGTATTNPAGTGTYTVALTAAQTADLDILTATWSDGATVAAVTAHEIVGGYYFSVAELRDRFSMLDPVKYPTSAVKRVRREVEDQCEQITGAAWVPRFTVDSINGSGTGTLMMPRMSLRSLRSVTPYTPVGDAATVFTAEQLAAVDASLAGVAVLTDGSGWYSGYRYTIAYEHGYDRPPADLKDAAMLHARIKLTRSPDALMDRATSFQPVDGGNVLLATPGRFGFETGIPEVDAVYARYDQRSPVIVAI